MFYSLFLSLSFEPVDTGKW